MTPYYSICWQSAQIACTANTYLALFLLSKKDINQWSEQYSMQLNNLEHPAGMFEVNSFKQSCLKCFQMHFNVDEYTYHNIEYIHNKLLVFFFSFGLVLGFLFLFSFFYSSIPAHKRKCRKKKGRVTERKLK